MGMRWGGGRGGPSAPSAMGRQLYKPRGETAEETQPADALHLDFSLQNCEKINSRC